MSDAPLPQDLPQDLSGVLTSLVEQLQASVLEHSAEREGGPPDKHLAEVLRLTAKLTKTLSKIKSGDDASSESSKEVMDEFGRASEELTRGLMEDLKIGLDKKSSIRRDEPDGARRLAPSRDEADIRSIPKVVASPVHAASISSSSPVRAASAASISSSSPIRAASAASPVASSAPVRAASASSMSSSSSSSSSSVRAAEVLPQPTQIGAKKPSRRQVIAKLRDADV